MNARKRIQQTKMFDFCFWKCKDFMGWLIISTVPVAQCKAKRIMRPCIHSCALCYFSTVLKARKKAAYGGVLNLRHMGRCVSQMKEGLLHWFRCCLLCCYWLFWDENGETWMVKRPLDGSTVFCCTLGNFCVTCENVNKIIMGNT